MRLTLIIILLTLASPKEASLTLWHPMDTGQAGVVLNDGILYRLEIKDAGVYQLDASWFSQNTDVPINNLRSSEIQIYGIGGGPLKHNSILDNTERLRPLPLSINDGGDEFINDQDYIRFYAEGPDRLYYDKSDHLYKLQKNPFDDSNFVILKIGGSIDQCLAVQEDQDVHPVLTTSYSLFSDIYHIDKVNLLDAYISTQGSGQLWLGDELSNVGAFSLNKKLNIPASGLDDVIIQATLYSRSSQREKVALIFGNSSVFNESSPVNTGDIEALYARTIGLQASTKTLNTGDELQISFEKKSPDAKLWLDYISIQGKAKATYLEHPTYFNNYLSFTESGDFDGLSISSSKDIIAWDISDPFGVVIKNLENLGDEKKMMIGHESFETYYCFTSGETLIPLSTEKINNQNLLEQSDVDIIMVSPALLHNQVKKLAQHRESKDQLTSIIVDPQEIYNQYSSGRQDPTAIRNYIRDVYHTYSRFKYVLLVGDASFDYRHINKGHPNNNLVPTFETFNSVDPLLAFPTDDYYALLDDGEDGRLIGDVDVAIGRLTVSNQIEAQAVIDKIISYDRPDDELNSWRTTIAFLADDEDNNLHINDADKIATEVSKSFPLANQEKIYFDAFIQESTPGGNRYPSATARLNRTVESGALVINYLGHGGPNGWAQERVLKVDDINSWSNFDKLPLIITATCSFTGFDNPSFISAGEAALLHPTGGALALFTTVRSVYASKNFQLTRSVFGKLFNKENGEYLRIGEIMRQAKNENPTDNTNARKFFLIGDPTSQLSIPPLNIVTESINGQAVEDVTEFEKVSALDVVRVTASVRSPENILLGDFNGAVDIVVYDKPTDLQTFANDKRSFIKTFKSQRNIIYKGRAKVVKGLIETSFTIPVDIDYNIDKGKIAYYANSTSKSNAAGYSDQLIIGGNSTDPVKDDLAPEIKIFLNNRSFTNGDKVPRSNLLIIDLKDDYGINVSSTGIGHEISAMLDDNSQSTLFLNEFYIGSKEDPAAGTIMFDLYDLDIGPHTLTVKAFDVANNVSQTTIDFVVSDDILRSISKVENSPNPFGEKTTFEIFHDFLDGKVRVFMDVYDISGRWVERHQSSEISRGGIVSVNWVPNITYSGTFVCYFTLSSETSGESELYAGKKVILLK